MRRRHRALACCVLAATTSVVLAQSAHESSSQSFPERARAFIESLQNPIPIPTGPAAVEKGAEVYKVHCASCHGPAGEGGKGPTLAQPVLPRAQNDADLLRVIRQGIEGTEMPRSRLEREEIGLVAAYVKSLGSRPPEVVPGDAERGRNLYATTGQCATCHTVNGYGGAFGPDLSDIGRKRSAAHLRQSLVDPNAEVPQSYSRTYEVRGMLAKLTSYDHATVGSGNVVNEVQESYNTFAQLVTEYQQHDAAVNTGHRRRCSAGTPMGRAARTTSGGRR